MLDVRVSDGRESTSARRDVDQAPSTASSSDPGKARLRDSKPGAMKWRILAQRRAQPNASRALASYTSRSSASPIRTPQLHGTHRHADHRSLGHSDRTRRTRARPPRDRRSPGPDRGHRAPARELAARFSAAETIERPTHVLLPGFVNAHTHAAMTLLRGAAESASLRALAQAAGLAARAALDRCRIRARRHRAGDRRHAHQRYDLLRRHAPVPGSRGADGVRQRASAPASACRCSTRRRSGPDRPTSTWTRACGCTTSIATIR